MAPSVGLCGHPEAAWHGKDRTRLEHQQVKSNSELEKGLRPPTKSSSHSILEPAVGVTLIVSGMKSDRLRSVVGCVELLLGPVALPRRVRQSQSQANGLILPECLDLFPGCPSGFTEGRRLEHDLLRYPCQSTSRLPSPLYF